MNVKFGQKAGFHATLERGVQGVNLFLDHIGTGKIRSERDLGKAFRRLVKSLHPDTSGQPDSADAFIRLRADYEEARRALRTARGAPAGLGKAPRPEGGRKAGDFIRCTRLFVDLVAGNFPLDPAIRSGVRQYCRRVQELDRELELFGPAFAGLASDAETELWRMRGASVLSSHEFNLVKMYLYRVSDLINMDTGFSRNYVARNLGMTLGVLADKGSPRTAFFLRWLVEGVLGGL